MKRWQFLLLFSVVSIVGLLLEVALVVGIVKLIFYLIG